MNADIPDLAELYDLDCGGFADDIPFTESLARTAGGPVLELGVGTARVALPLAKAGLEVWGIDASDEMLARARCQIEEAGTSIELRNGRMQDFDLGQRFGFVYAAFGTLHHLLSDEDVVDCLERVERHLLPAGTFACDLRPLFFEDWEHGESVPVFHDWSRTLPRSGERVTKFRAVRSDARTHLKSEAILYDIVGADGSVRRVEREQRLRYFSRDEIESTVERVGLEVEALHGGYNGEPYDEAGDHLILVARKLEGTA